MLQIVEKTKTISINIPLTSVTGKVRIKERSWIHSYGTSVATRQVTFKLTHYVEWQIGYDIDLTKEENKLKTSLPHLTFLNYKGKSKALYELSEILYYFYKWNIISYLELENLLNKIMSFNVEDLIENNSKYAITRDNPTPEIVCGVSFEKSIVKYPTLVHIFKEFVIIAEVIVKEKQRAIGTQPMLYLCFPISELDNFDLLLNRVANQNETAKFIFS